MMKDQDILECLKNHQAVEQAELDAFINRNMFPYIHGSSATFIFSGDADQVNLRHWIFGLPSTQPFIRIENTNIWSLVMDIPPMSRIEYKIEMIHQGNHRWIQDPLNHNLAFDPFGANSVIHGEGYKTPEWSEYKPESRRGLLREFKIQSKHFGDERYFSVYLPARYKSTRRYPLLIVHDGGDYIKFSNMKCILDNLIYRHEIQPLIVVFTYPKDRIIEYANDTRHQDYLAEEIVPFMYENFPVYDQHKRIGLMGASFGAIASLSTAWRHSDLFENLLLQSGSFAFTDIGHHTRTSAFDPVVEFMNQFRKNPKNPCLNMYQSCGMYETLIYENRSMLPFFQNHGIKVKYREARDGHNWINWRDRMREGLAWLYPGPLWMFYE